MSDGKKSSGGVSSNPFYDTDEASGMLETSRNTFNRSPVVVCSTTMRNPWSKPPLKLTDLLFETCKLNHSAFQSYTIHQMGYTLPSLIADFETMLSDLEVEEQWLLGRIQRSKPDFQPQPVLTGLVRQARETKDEFVKKVRQYNTLLMTSRQYKEMIFTAVQKMNTTEQNIGTTQKAMETLIKGLFSFELQYQARTEQHSALKAKKDAFQQSLEFTKTWLAEYQGILADSDRRKFGLQREIFGTTHTIDALFGIDINFLVLDDEISQDGKVDGDSSTSVPVPAPRNAELELVMKRVHRFMGHCQDQNTLFHQLLTLIGYSMIAEHSYNHKGHLLPRFAYLDPFDEYDPVSDANLVFTTRQPSGTTGPETTSGVSRVQSYVNPVLLYSPPDVTVPIECVGEEGKIQGFRVVIGAHHFVPFQGDVSAGFSYLQLDGPITRFVALPRGSRVMVIANGQFVVVDYSTGTHPEIDLPASRVHYPGCYIQATPDFTGQTGPYPFIAFSSSAQPQPSSWI